MLILEPLERVRGACKHSHQKLRRVSLLGLTGVMLRRYGGIPGGIPRVLLCDNPNPQSPRSASPAALHTVSNLSAHRGGKDNTTTAARNRILYTVYEACGHRLRG